MKKATTYIQTNRAALFDWLVISTSVGLGFIYPTITDFTRSPGFSYWMLSALLLYIAGAALKHVPLSTRIRRRGSGLQPVPYIIFLLVGHWFIMLFVIILAEPALRYLLSLPALTDKNRGSWELVLFSALGAVFITWLVYRTKSTGKNRKNYSAGYLFRQEAVADGLLIAAVSVFTFLFWEKGVMAMLDRASTQTIGDIWFLFVFLSILFLFFYLPLRYLFFMEDREKAGNRKRLFLIFGFMLLKALFEMLNI